MDIVTITNIHDNQIFQQKNGRASIKVTGRVVTDDPKLHGKYVWFHLKREEDSTYVILPTKAAQNEDGTYEAVLENVPAGGMYTLTCQLGDESYRSDWELRGEARFHLGVGDLFLIAGQSNSAGYGLTPGYDPADPMVHLFRNEMTWHTAAHPLSDSTRSAHPVNADWATTGSSPHIRFAAAMRRALGYPIGLVQVSKGDTFLFEWTPEDFPEPLAGERGYGKRVAGLWHNMLSVVEAVGGSIAGVLWYQGCNDTDAPLWTEVYPQRFAHMVASLRTALGQPDLPFYTVQLNKETEVTDPGEILRWGMIKEFQRRAAREIPHVHVTTSHDLPMSDRIHNNTVANTVIGERLAWLALETEYKKPYFGKAPDICRASVVDGRIRLDFDNVYAFIVFPGMPVNDFHLYAGEAELPLSGVYPAGSSIFLTPAEPLPADVGLTVSFACHPQLPCALPFDRLTGIPLLSFCHFPVD